MLDDKPKDILWLGVLFIIFITVFIFVPLILYNFAEKIPEWINQVFWWIGGGILTLIVIVTFAVAFFMRNDTGQPPPDGFDGYNL